MAVRSVKRDIAGVAQWTPLTNCQSNRTKVAVRTVRRDMAEPGMESLTFCQANETRVAVRTVRRTQLDLPWNHSLSVKQIGSEWQ